MHSRPNDGPLDLNMIWLDMRYAPPDFFDKKLPSRYPAVVGRKQYDD